MSKPAGTGHLTRQRRALPSLCLRGVSTATELHGLFHEATRLRERGCALCWVDGLRAFQREPIPSVDDVKRASCLDERVMPYVRTPIAHRASSRCLDHRRERAQVARPLEGRDETPPPGQQAPPATSRSPAPGVSPGGRRHRAVACALVTRVGSVLWDGIDAPSDCAAAILAAYKQLYPVSRASCQNAGLARKSCRCPLASRRRSLRATSVDWHMGAAQRAGVRSSRAAMFGGLDTPIYPPRVRKRIQCATRRRTV